MKFLHVAFQTLLCAASFSARAEVVRVASNRLEIGVDTAHGGLVELADRSSNFNQLADEPVAPPLWSVTLRDGDNIHTLSSELLPTPTIEHVPGDPRALHLVWNKFTNIPQLSCIEVFVTFDKQNSALSRWNISVSKDKRLRIETIRFPAIGSLRERRDESLAVAKQLGLLAHDPRAVVERSHRRITWHSPHGTDLSLPCIALYQPDGPGFYAACDDTEGFIKDFSLSTDGKNHLDFQITHVPEQSAVDQTNFNLPFTAVLGVFQGDWTTAAEIYRESQPAKKFAAEGLRRQRLSPSWVRQTGVWLWNRGRSQQVLDPAVALRAHIDAPVSVLWHWWHSCAYDTGFPEFLPPREGSAPFKAALANAKRRDIHAILYMNQRLWGTNTASWRDENAKVAAVKSADGKVVTESYNKFTNALCAPMCIATHQWRDKYAGLAEDVLCDLRADGIYMDQAGVLANCYDSTHGHITGPGRYWTDGFATLTTDIRDRSSKRGPVALGCEYGGEPWLGEFDLTLGLCVSHDRIGGDFDWEPIPFFQAVYHPSSTVFGNLTGLAYPPYDEKWPAESIPATAMSLLDRKYCQQFYLDQARTFVWGMQPMLANFLPEQMKQRSDEIDFVTRLVHTRMRALKYLADGTWLRPPNLDVPQQEIDVAKLGVYTPLKSARRKYPVAIDGAWRAPDGDIAIALASISETQLHVTLPIDMQSYGLGEQCSVYRIDAKGRHRIALVTRQHSSIELNLAPRDLCVLEFPASNLRTRGR